MLLVARLSVPYNMLIIFIVFVVLVVMAAGLACFLEKVMNMIWCPTETSCRTVR